MIQGKIRHHFYDISSSSSYRFELSTHFPFIGLNYLHIFHLSPNIFIGIGLNYLHIFHLSPNIFSAGVDGISSCMQFPVNSPPIDLYNCTPIYCHKNSYSPFLCLLKLSTQISKSKGYPRPNSILRFTIHGSDG